MKSLIYFAIIMFFCISFISATITPSVSLVNLNPSNTFQTVEFINSNLSDNGTYTLSVSSSLSNVLDMNFNNLVYPSGRYVTFSIKSNAPVGSYSGTVTYDGSTLPISVYIQNSTNITIIDHSGCQINPSLVSYYQTMQKGANIPLPKITFNPVDCSGSLILTASSVSIQGGIVTSEGIQKPVTISSVVSDGINLQINTEGLNTQTYTSTLKINTFSKSFEIPFTIIITAGTNPSGSFNINNLPSCSITSTSLSLNSSYSLVCSNIQSDITINPVYDAEYIKGTGIDSTINQFSWFFTPKKYGNTFIQAQFKYQNVPVGDMFSQEVRITSTGSNIGGTDLKLSFTPLLDLTREGDTTIIQLIDNKTGSLVNTPKIFVDAKELNSSSLSFEYKFKTGQDYQIRGTAPGYSDLVQTIKVVPKEIPFNINPSSGDTSTTFTINSSVSNVTIKIGSNTYSSYFYGSLPTGVNSIQLSKEGYLVTTFNISIDQSNFITNQVDFQKGQEQNILLSKNSSSFIVWYQEDLNSVRESYYSGIGNKITFVPKKNGIYTIEADGKTIQTYNLDGFDWSKVYFKLPLWLWIVIFVFIVLVITVIIIKSRASNIQDNALVYQTGN